jgi:hypothetical protein
MPPAAAQWFETKKERPYDPLAGGVDDFADEDANPFDEDAEEAAMEAALFEVEEQHDPEALGGKTVKPKGKGALGRKTNKRKAEGAVNG